MIPKHQEKEFKLQLAARVKLRHEKTSDPMIDILLDVYSAFKKKEMDTIVLGQEGLFKSKEAFYQFTYDNAEDISAICSEIGTSGTESGNPVQDFAIDTGGRERDGGSAHREMTSDAALKATDNEEFTVRTLEAFARELGFKVNDTVTAKARRYARVITKGLG